jgi:hypothetical protein
VCKYDHDGGSTKEIYFPKPVIAGLGTDMYIQEFEEFRRCKRSSRDSQYSWRKGEVVGS